ncbi:aspartyl-tRNA(Asn)/glutamyl-tRNA (Gln) amidotransferase subunit A [Sporothrix schenckii 1099-18]|uniref:Glutamyl-tRNA(Gln) amidotransferase subunit A, mitochondrial n=1 Tax=Sporothrix schenckii 1099-18 TaxID=1397361 RepID=A0A0F2MME5_SPOSC|nr:aspartyl-tRNA(Asn)/glutamyl-tRNA (Gln) amidotransferase subunit A [Sporothrix schenckii 1099-18]KJR89356.1 aspartyl-tRNA(Asn)/glutamyl-tRNA (Gln) amidotransferase subunit A [Sporothrix schenckii 1099-18]
MYFPPEPADTDADASSPPFTFTLAVKDNIATRSPDDSTSTTCGSRILQNYKSPFEATIVTQLRRRGARVVGKTNLDEFGMGSHSLFSHFGGTYERPHDPSSGSAGSAGAAVSVGGSSGGSSVAVRLGDVDVALGTDTGGSVRLPAAYGGVVGFKPSYGMLSRFGVVPYANSLDTVGLLAPTVAPIRRLIVGEDPTSKRSEEQDQTAGLWRESDVDRDPTSLTLASRLRIAGQRMGYNGETFAPDLRGMTFGIPLEYNIEELDPRIRTAWAAAAERLRSLGATIAAVSLPSTRHALSAYYVIAPAEAASNLARYDGVRYGQIGDLGAEVETASEAEAKAEPETKPETTPPTGEADGEQDEAVLYERVRGAGLGREVQRRILLGNYVLSSSARDNYFVQAQRVRRVIVRDFDAVFRLPNPLRDHKPVGEHQGVYTDDARGHIDLSDLPEGLPLADKRGPAQVDFLLCPTAPTPAPRVADVEAAPSAVDAYINDVFTVPASLAGLPAISIPMPAADTGTATEAEAFCPGFQLIGQFFDDARLLQVAETVMTAAFEQPEDMAALEKHRKTGVST